MGKKRMQSPSSMNTYFQCPRKYYFIYKLKLPTKPSIHLVRGSVAHLALEKLYDILPEVIADNHKENLKTVIVELLRKYWLEAKDDFDKLSMSEQQLESYFEETKDMLLNYIARFTDKLEAHMFKGLSFVDAFKKLTPLREKEYLSWDYYVKGFIDVIEDDDGKIRLMDYKTSKRAQINDAYKLQLAVYALLYEMEHHKKPHEVGIYFLKYKGADGEQVIPVDEELIKHAKFKIEQIHMSTTSDDIADYPLHKTPLCKWSSGQCDFYDYCYNGKEIPPLPEPKVVEKK